MTLWTIGHSTRSSQEFVEILTHHGVRAVADVRRYPASRRFPHFNREPLAASLRAGGIEYESFSELGGRRPRRPGSANTAWRDPGFQGYADYMETAAFRDGLERLVAFAAPRPTAIMCAEALWWRCHRGLIADALKAAGHTVVHIVDGSTQDHPYTAAARIVEGRLSYRNAAEADLFPPS
ncbi:MAG TPA: DUF488 domain-containing protein [Candidatus Sulfotelmatobacter sp.]|nr:DUF488 domain-containing protein [Candidatus Sulfotelmatobacter sp.]